MNFPKNLLNYGNALSIVSKNGVASVDALSKVITGLTQAQATNVLVTNNQALGYHKLNSVQMYNALVKSGMTKEEAKNTVATVLNTQAKKISTAETKKSIIAEIASEGIIKKSTATDLANVAAKMLRKGATEAEVTAKLLEILATQGVTGAVAQETAAKIMQIPVNAGLLASIKALTVELLKQTAAFLATPFGMIAAAIGSVVLMYNAWKTGIEAADKAITEQSDKLSTAKNKFEELKSKIESTEQELSDVNSRISELQSFGTLSLVEQTELEKLQSLNRELKITKGLLEVEMSQAQTEMSKDAQSLAEELSKTNDYGTSLLKTLAGIGLIAGGFFVAGGSAIAAPFTAGTSLAASVAGASMMAAGASSIAWAFTTEYGYQDKKIDNNIKKYNEAKAAIDALTEAEIKNGKSKEQQDNQDKAHQKLVERLRHWQEVKSNVEALEFKGAEDLELLNEANSAIEEIYKNISPATYAQIKFDQLINLEGFEDVPARLEKLGEESANKYRQGILDIIKSLPQEFKDSIGEGLSDEEIAIKIGFTLDALENLKTEIDKALGQNQDNIENGIRLPITLELADKLKVSELEEAQRIIADTAEVNGKAAAQIKAQSIANIFSADGGKLVSSIRQLQSEYPKGTKTINEANDEIRAKFKEVFVDATKEDIDTFMEIFALVPKTVTNGTQETIAQINSLADSFDNLGESIDKLSKGESLTNQEVLDLVEKFPELIDKMQVDPNTGIMFIPVDALKEQQDSLSNILKKDIAERQAYYEEKLKDLDANHSADEDYLTNREEYIKQLNRLNVLEKMDISKLESVEQSSRALSDLLKSTTSIKSIIDTASKEMSENREISASTLEKLVESGLIIRSSNVNPIAQGCAA